MMALIYTIIILIFIVINKIMLKSFFNYLNVFLLIWYVSTILSMEGFYDFIVPPTKAYIYILITLIFFEAFSIIFLNVKMKKYKNATGEKQIKTSINYKIMTALTFLVTIIMIPTTVKGLQILMDGGFNKLRNIGFTLELYTSYQKILLVYIVKPLNIALLIYSLIDFVDTNKIRPNLILCILNVIQYIVTFGGRSPLLEIALLATIIVIDKYNSNLYKIIKNNKKIIFLAIVVVVAMIYITSQRSLDKEEGFLFNLYSYYVGSIHLFGIHLNNESMSLLDGEHLLYGREMFNSIAEFINIFGSILNLNVQTGIEIVNQVTQKFIYVSPKVLMNNNVTMLYAFLRDFDIYGLIIGPAVLAFIYAISYKAKNKTNKLQYKGVYYYLLSQLPYFLFEFVLVRGSIVFTIVAILGLNIIIKEKGRE